MIKSRVVLIFTIFVLAGAVTARPSAAEERPPSRRLVLCLDGTLNSPEQAIESSGKYKLYKPTNALKTCRAVLPVGDDGVSQIAYYSEGVGSFIGEPTPIGRFEQGVDRLTGGAWAIGYEARVKSAYRFLVSNYQDQDQIVVFGFSRGAAEAQTLVRFIDWAGGVLHKADEYYIAELYANFRDTGAAPGGGQAALSTIRERRKNPGAIKDPRQAEIDFLGVYETVVSVGSRLAPDGKVTTVAQQYAFLVGPTPPKIVKTARQALAIDERRWDFRPQVWESAAPENHSQNLVQLWFPGVHSNIGGGYEHDGLADRVLGWMLDEAKAVHLSVDRQYLAHYLDEKPACYEPSRPDTYNFAAQFGELIRGKRGRGVRKLETWDEQGGWERAGLGFHPSLATLLTGDCTYRPKNLLEFLARNDRRIDDFPPEQRTAVRKIVDDFRVRAGQKKGTPERCQPTRCAAPAAGN